MANNFNPQAWNGSAGVASNSGADGGIGTVADSSSPDTVDNWTRGIMAAVRNYILDCGGALAPSGTNTLTVTTNQVLSTAHLVDGLTITLEIQNTNTGATTFNPDSAGAKAVVDQFGNALVGGELRAGMKAQIQFNQGADNWRLLNPATGGKPRFFAYLGSVQNIASTNETLVGYDTESFDRGGHFASSIWTPPAGPVMIGGAVTVISVGSGGVNAIIKKNTTTILQPSNVLFNVSSAMKAEWSILQEANGTDTFSVCVQTDTDTSYALSSGLRLNHFWGMVV